MIRFTRFVAAVAIAALLAVSASAQFAQQATWGGTSSGPANAQVVALANVGTVADLLGVDVSFVAGSTNTAAAQLNIGGVGLHSVLKPSSTGLTALTGGEFVAGGLTTVQWDGTEYVLKVNYANVAPQKVLADTTFYVSSTGSDTNNTCIVSGLPCLTVQHAWNILVSQFNLNGFNATIHMADGTYTSAVQVSSMPLGVLNTNSVVFDGNAGTPGNVIFSTGASNGITATGPVRITLQNFAMQSTSGNLIEVSFGASVSFTNIVFGSAGSAGNQIYVHNNGSVLVAGAYTINAGANAHVQATLGGSFSMDTKTLTLTGTPAFVESFFAIGALGNIQFINEFSGQITGSATGNQWQISGNSILYTNGNCGAPGANRVPGSISGSTSTGGICY